MPKSILASHSTATTASEPCFQNRQASAKFGYAWREHVDIEPSQNPRRTAAMIVATAVRSTALTTVVILAAIATLEKSSIKRTVAATIAARVVAAISTLATPIFPFELGQSCRSYAKDDAMQQLAKKIDTMVFKFMSIPQLR